MAEYLAGGYCDDSHDADNQEKEGGIVDGKGHSGDYEPEAKMRECR